MISSAFLLAINKVGQEPLPQSKNLGYANANAALSILTAQPNSACACRATFDDVPRIAAKLTQQQQNEWLPAREVQKRKL